MAHLSTLVCCSLDVARVARIRKLFLLCIYCVWLQASVEKIGYLTRAYITGEGGTRSCTEPHPNPVCTSDTGRRDDHKCYFSGSLSVVSL